MIENLQANGSPTANRNRHLITPNYSGANHHPIAVVNGTPTRQVIQISAAANSNGAPSAAGASDPLVMRWVTHGSITSNPVPTSHR